MAIRTALLSGRNVNLDTDFSKYIETVSEPGVISGLAVSTNSVATGLCRVPCERTNGETIYALVESFSATTIDTSGTGYVIVSIGQTYIDDGSLGNEDGTGIATISVVNELPSKNYLELASISSGTITDTRNMIKKVGELNTAIQSIFGSIEDLDERVEALEKAGAIDHLEEQALVGENYSLENSLYKQKTPDYTNCSVEQNVGDVEANTEVHIQRLGSGTASDKLKLYVKKVGSPTTTFKVEVRKGIKVNVSDSEAYWYGDEENIIATGSISYSSLTTDFQDIEITMSSSFGGEEGELLDVVVYQENSGEVIVNDTNYFIIGCDSSQWSEAFSLVKVNGTTRTRSKVMPYCVSSGFAEYLLVKTSSDIVLGYSNLAIQYGSKTFAAEGRAADTGTDDDVVIKNTSSSSWTVSFTSAYFSNPWSDGLKLLPNYKVGTGSLTALQYTTTDNESQAPVNNITDITLASGQELTWRYQNNFSYGTNVRGTSCKRYYLNVTITGNLDLLKTPDIVLYPRSEKNIGEIGYATSFGRHIDNSWKTGQEEGEEPLTIDSLFPSSMYKYVTSKGTVHYGSINNNTPTYTCIGYGVAYCYSNAGSGYSGGINVNGMTVCAVDSTTYFSSFNYVFFKPGDVFSVTGSATSSCTCYDYY